MWFGQGVKIFDIGDDSLLEVNMRLKIVYLSHSQRSKLVQNETTSAKPVKEPNSQGHFKMIPKE